MTGLELKTIKMHEVQSAPQNAVYPDEVAFEPEDEALLKRESEAEVSVDGSIQLYDVDRLSFVPMPTSDPRGRLGLLQCTSVN